MVFFNYATMQMAAKIVYYGPGLCGKTTNLHHIYGRTAPGSRGEMVSLETETDRTLFFDLLPLDVGMVGGFKTRVQLYTVPGQVFYNTTRKLVLKGVDGIVFVADSQIALKDANVESLVNLRTNLEEIGLQLEDLPLVFQYNKRDLGEILTLQQLEDSLNPHRDYESYEACAVRGQGVFETLKAVSKLTLRSLKKKMGEGRASEPAPRRIEIVPDTTSVEAASRESASKKPRAEAAQPDPTIDAALPPVKSDASGDRRPPASEESSAEPPVEVKHVRVRSNVDILAELDKLRKNATATPGPESRPPSTPSGVSIDDLLGASFNHRKEVNRVFDLQVPRSELARGQQITVGLRLEDSESKPIGEKKTFSIELDPKADLEKLLLSLKFNISGK